MNTHDFGHLKVGGRYAVIRPFLDFDSEEHPVGEVWTFRGHSFLPYDDGLSLFVEVQGHGRRQIRMRWLEGDQSHIIDNLRDYLAPADD